MLKAFAEKQQVDFFTRHGRTLLPYPMYVAVNRNDPQEIAEWNRRLVLLGAVDKAPWQYVQTSKATAELLVSKKEPPSQGLIPDKNAIFLGMSLR